MSIMFKNTVPAEYKGYFKFLSLVMLTKSNTSINEVDSDDFGKTFKLDIRGVGRDNGEITLTQEEIDRTVNVPELNKLAEKVIDAAPVRDFSKV